MKDFTGKRTVPAPPNDAELFSADPAAVGQFKFSLLTPMFGGGVEARQIDPITPVRVSEIRGHLRYWWRLLNRGPEMAAKEAAIWGSTKSASRVRLRAEVTEKVSKPCGAWGATPGGRPRFDFIGPEYFLFPFRPDAPASAVLTAWTRLDFQLFVSIDKGYKDYFLPVLQALILWANFGGLGSRTRRGCGALFCEQLAQPTLDDLRSQAPRKGFRMFTGPIATDSIGAWRAIADAYQRFRQKEVGRAGLGRSHWPEPDSLRAATGVGDPNHMSSATLRTPGNPHFPRAEFGLPIVFHFKPSGGHEQSKNDASLSGNLAPVVNGESRDRMASPLILRPVKLKDGKIVPTIIRLVAPGPDSLSYQFENKEAQKPGGVPLADQPFPVGPLDSGRFIAGAPIIPHIAGHTSIIDAFLAHATGKQFGFREIAPRP